MNIILTLYKILLEALFPISNAEREILEMSPEEALELLPPAPGYEGLAVPLQNSRSIFAYKDERVKKLVWNIKYKESRSAIGIGGYALLQSLARVATEGRLSQDTPSTIIIPLPITSRRRKERGYNQCELLVGEIKRITENTPTSPNKFLFENNLLIRTQHSSRQTLKGRSDRLESAKGIFEVNEEVIEQLQIQLMSNTPGSDIKKIPVIIIDDVITTGSTMYEAIETLKKAGFEDVSGLSLAH